MNRVPSSIRPLLAAVAEECVSQFVPGTGIAKAAFKAFGPAWLKPEYFLHWDNSAEILHFYRNQQNVISFRHNGAVFCLPQALEINNVDNTINVDKIFFRMSSAPFMLAPALFARSETNYRRYKRFLTLRRRKWHNGELLRLTGYRQENDSLCLNTQLVTYTDVCKTNLILDAPEDQEERTMRTQEHEQHEIERLEESRLANSLGVNIVLLTADTKLVLPLRSRRVIVRPGQFSPSSSGAFDYTDALGGRLHRGILLREGLEEIGVSERHLKLSSLRFLGLTRELVRGGKPEAFFSGQTTLASSDFKRMHREVRDKYEFTHPRSWEFWPMSHGEQDKSYELRGSFDKLLWKHGDRISVPLLTNILLWLRAEGVTDV